MSKADNILGVGKVEIGVPGDGVVSAALVEFKDVEVNSVSFEGEVTATEILKTENNENYLTVDGETTPASVKLRLLGVPLSEYPMLMGGTFADDKYSAPKKKSSIYLSLVLTSLPNNGKTRVITIPYAHAEAKVQGNITKNALPAVDITFTANIPVTASGVEGSPYTVEDL
ncbi:hypothetical protein [Flavicella sediminum]|uniref:hypothetical protein n=1 Tax=Flavicella sediminum TaxID=2585141 RepID=UPI00112029E3|nr:hypothetical protein [Flavicella sediminum]